MALIFKFKDQETFQKGLKALPGSKPYKPGPERSDGFDDEGRTVYMPYNKNFDWAKALVPELEGDIGSRHKPVGELLKPAGVVFVGMAAEEKQLQKMNNMREASKTFDEISEYLGVFVLDLDLKHINNNVKPFEVPYKDIPKQLLKNIQEAIKDNCLHNFDDSDDAEHFKKKFKIEKVFEDNDASLSITETKSGEKVYFLFIDSDRYTFYCEMSISADGIRFCELDF